MKYSARQIAEKLKAENPEKVFFGKINQCAVIIYCDHPEDLKIPEETGWHYTDGKFVNEQDIKSGMRDTLAVFPTIYM